MPTKLYSRVRPNVRNTFKKKVHDISRDENIITIYSNRTNVTNKKIIEHVSYNFDKIFDIDYSNEDIFNELGNDIINNFLNNENVVFYVYGQTGSGKTYTLLGDDNNMGLLEMILSSLTIKRNINYSAFQIYNNNSYDLFTNKLLKECENMDGSISYLNLTKHNLPKNLKELIYNIKQSRYVGVSSSNNTSSRSHLIFQIYNGSNYLQIIDLAGSEKASRCVSNELHNMRENAGINLSILALKECIRNINKTKIPYRNSKLTKILKNTFSNKVNVYILSTISPLKCDLNETKNTLKYISDMKEIRGKKSSPIYKNKFDKVDRLNTNLKKELSKDRLERQVLIDLIEQNIKSLKDLKSNIINI